jgi:SAM-dependent methyltransferase
MINSRVTAEGYYFQQLRKPLLSLAHGRPRRVLEIGCAAGQSLAYFKARGAEYVAGVELSSEVAALARARPGVDDVVVGNIEQLTLDFAPESFDLLVAGHVLEHTADPWAVLRKLRPYLRPGGQLIGAVPNVRHTSVLLPLLLRGAWQYQESGIMDWTHLRFFTRGTIVQLLRSTGFDIEHIQPEMGGPRSSTANRLTAGVFQDLLGYAYNFSARRPRAQV